MIIHELGSIKPKLANGEYRRALQCSAVAHCQKNWERVYRSVLKEFGGKALARVHAGEAFRAAMPLLVGDENIRDFIACVTFAMATGILLEETASKLLYAAQVAFNTASPRTNMRKKAPKNVPKSSDSSTLGRKQLPLPPQPPPLKTKDLPR